jgi:hypothetical protein
MATDMSCYKLMYRDAFISNFIRDARMLFEEVIYNPIAFANSPFPKAQFNFGLLRSILSGEKPFPPFEENMMRIFSSIEITEDFVLYALHYIKFGIVYSGSEYWSCDFFSELFCGTGSWESFVKSCNYSRNSQVKEPLFSEIFCSCSTVPHHPINGDKCFFGTSIYFGPIPKCWVGMWDISRTHYLPSEFMARRYKQREDGSHENNFGWYLTQEEFDTFEDWPDNLDICGDPIEE